MTPAPRWWREDMPLPAGFYHQTFTGRKLKLDTYPHTSREDASHLQNICSWICAEIDETQQNAFDDLFAATEALQIACPFEWLGHMFAVDKESFNLIRSAHYATAFNYGWSKNIDFPGIPTERPKVCLDGYLQARHDSVVRLMNPTLLLIQGMHARNPLIALLLWTMGLDAIVSTNDANIFRARLSKLLGEQTLFMPKSEFFGQPDYKVGETAAEIYTLRGIIAHGNEIPQPFRERVGLKIVNAKLQLPEEYKRWASSYVLSECAALLLCAAIQRIYEEARIYTLAAGKSSIWTNWLDK